MGRLGVKILAGFLGSGKTTLVNRLLSEPGAGRFAVLVNEFGEVGIDGRLVVAAEEDLVELANGCVCCTIRGDLERALRELVLGRKRLIGRRPFDGVLIEASGLASPGPIAQTLAAIPELSEALGLDGIVTLVHAGRIATQLEQFPEAAEQVGLADLLVLNHLDHATADELAAAEAALLQRNSLARVVHAERSEIDLELLCGDFHNQELGRAVSSNVHSHTSEVLTLALSSDEPLDLHRLKMWLGFLETRPDGQILRLKGILRCRGQARPVVVQGVYQWLELNPGAGAPPARSELVLIGRGFDPEELERGWQASLARS